MIFSGKEGWLEMLDACEIDVIVIPTPIVRRPPRVSSAALGSVLQRVVPA